MSLPRDRLRPGQDVGLRVGPARPGPWLGRGGLWRAGGQPCWGRDSQTLGHWQQLLETTSLAKAVTFCNAFSTKKVLRRSLAVLGWAALPARFPVALGSPYPVTEQLGDSAVFSLPFYFISALQVPFASDYLWWFVSHV